MPREGQPQRLLRPPQFGLRTLFLAVTALGIFLAAAQHLSPLAVGVAGFLLLSLAAHIAANALGTRLRGGTGGGEPFAHAAPRSTSEYGAKPVLNHPATNLSQRKSLGWTLVIAGGIGLTLGAAGGALWPLSSEREVGWFPVVIGAVAFGTLGALAAVLAAGFVQSAWSAWREALRSS